MEMFWTLIITKANQKWWPQVLSAHLLLCVARQLLYYFPFANNLSFDLNLNSPGLPGKREQVEGGISGKWFSEMTWQPERNSLSSVSLVLVSKSFFPRHGPTPINKAWVRNLSQALAESFSIVIIHSYFVPVDLLGTFQEFWHVIYTVIKLLDKIAIPILEIIKQTF